MPNLVLIDTWGWLALGHRRDSHHREINALYWDTPGHIDSLG
jgi:hypothetical protein